MDWLPKPFAKDQATKLRMLEIGALSTDNACSKSGIFDVTRIDLNSQGSGIRQQDFMERPLPSSEAEKFDIISLSLVLNYVPDAPSRGEMLRRTCEFLLSEPNVSLNESQRAFFPSLFLVLPAPCVTNSRYLDKALLATIMNSLGYRLIEHKTTSKLVYYLWQFDSVVEKKRVPKREVNPGRARNNFCVILE